MSTIKPLTKAEMIADLNQMLCRFYGGQTEVSAKVRNLPKNQISHLHRVWQLWRNDSLAEQVDIVERHIRHIVS